MPRRKLPWWTALSTCLLKLSKQPWRVLTIQWLLPWKRQQKLPSLNPLYMGVLECSTARCVARATRPMTILAIVLSVGWTWSKRSLPKASSRAIRRITSAKSYAANSGEQWLLPYLSSSSPWGGCGMTILCISSCH